MTDKRPATLDDVVAALTALEARHTAHRDRRAVFATVYTMMSQEMRRRIERRAFRDNEWVRRYTVAFANLYFAAHENFDSGRERVQGVADRLRDRETQRGARDAGSAARRERAHQVGRRVSELYARGLAGVDACAGTLDEAVSHFSMAVARAGAWESAVALANARADVERRGIRQMLDLRSAAMARLILTPNLNPVLLAKCRIVEQSAWWDLLSAARAAADAEARSV